MAAAIAVPIPAIAQNTTPSPGQSPAAGDHLTGTVTAFKGLVRYRNTPDQPWAMCKVGLTVAEGAEFQTGLHSNVQLLVPPQQTITLDRMGSMTLLEAVKQNGKYTTDVGMKHGRVRYNIEAPGIEHESTVSTPNGTLAVRDTEFYASDERPFPPEAGRLSGTVEFTTAKKTISIGGTIAGSVKAVGDQDPANSSLSAAVVDPSIQLARTPSEQPLVANLLSRGAVFSTQTTKVIPVVSGGFPPTDDQLQKTLPGNLDFVLRWNTNVNLDLAVVVLAKGETLYPATGLNNSRSGGIIPFNDIGGPHGGIELAYWNKSFPVGYYEVVVNDLSPHAGEFHARRFRARHSR